MNNYYKKSIEYFNSIQEVEPLVLDIYLTYYPLDIHHIKEFETKQECIEYINKIVFGEIVIEGMAPTIEDCIGIMTYPENELDEHDILLKQYYLEIIFKGYVKRKKN
jgi:hypothetical protein